LGNGFYIEITGQLLLGLTHEAGFIGVGYLGLDILERIIMDSFL
jgi:uncharacterized protein YunC (DUF1805 family)